MFWFRRSSTSPTTNQRRQTARQWPAWAESRPRSVESEHAQCSSAKTHSKPDTHTSADNTSAHTPSVGRKTSPSAVTWTKATFSSPGLTLVLAAGPQERVDDVLRHVHTLACEFGIFPVGVSRRLLPTRYASYLFVFSGASFSRPSCISSLFLLLSM